MSTPLFVISSIQIQAPVSRVWNLLVNPQETKKYMFGCEAVSEWKPGSELVWKGMLEGKEMIFVKGKVVSIEPEKTLVYTVIDPNSNIEDIPENYLTVTYNLTFEGGGTKLKVTQGDYALVADGVRRYSDSNNNGEGWNPILVQIKRIAEQG